jgi:hypothetical protein
MVRKSTTKVPSVSRTPSNSLKPSTRVRACKDCGSSSRKLPHPGPRCATCHRKARRGASDRRRAAHLLNTYQLTMEEYDRLYEAQGGVCAVCQRATGKVRKLAVDHDHSCCAGKISCGKCVRMLACSTCNKMLGHLRDDPEAFERAAKLLREPPAREVLGKWDGRKT